MEKHGSSLLAGKITRVSNESRVVIYQVGLTAPVASVGHSGRYKCSFDRKDDHLIVVTKVKVLHSDFENVDKRVEKDSYRKRGKRRNKSLDAGRNVSCRRCSRSKKKSKKNRNASRFKGGKKNDLQTELVSCEGGALVGEEWLVKEGASTCLRCRGRDNNGKKLKVSIQRDGVNLEKIFNIPPDTSHRNFLKNIRHSRIYLLKRSKKKRNSFYQKTKKFLTHKKKMPKRSTVEKRKDLMETCSFTSAKRCVGLERFVNVVDGGVYETSLTLHNPHPSSFPIHGHHFTCHVSSFIKHKELHFRIRYV